MGALIVQGGLAKTGDMKADAPRREKWANPPFLDCAELSHRLGLPVVAAISTGGEEPYLSTGQGDRRGVPAELDAQVREAFSDAREMFAPALPMTMRREADLRAWCAEQLRAIRQELEAAEASLAVGTPWQGTYAPEEGGRMGPGDRATFDYGRRIADLAARYADTLLDLHCNDERTIEEDE